MSEFFDKGWLLIMIPSGKHCLDLAQKPSGDEKNNIAALIRINQLP
jgi:hypothetical protein